MITEELVYAALACPQLDLDDSFFEFIVAEHSRQTVDTFLKRYAYRLSDTGLTDLFSSWLSGEIVFETVWDPSFGGCYAALLQEVDDVERRAAALALRLHECGHLGEWEVRLPAAARLRFGRFLLPRADIVRVSSTSRRVAITTSHDGVRAQLHFERGPDFSWTGDGVPLPSVRPEANSWLVLPSDLVDTWEFEGLRAGMDAGTPAPLLRGCQNAIDVIANSGSLYRNWINRVIRFLVPWQTLPGQLPSGSSSGACFPGVIGIGNHDHPLALADTLVHEATHQYCYVMTKLGPLSDGTDKNLYYNPFLEMNRPLDRIVLAYHAFANVLMFWRDASPLDVSVDPYLKQRMRVLLSGLAILEESLQKAQGLTFLGRALWEPLYEQVHG